MAQAGTVTPVTSSAAAAPRALRGLPSLVASLVLVGIVATVAGRLGSADTAWYRALDKAPWNPPGWAFGAAWSVLYIGMGVAAWLVLRQGLDRAAVRAGLALHLLQLALNLAWTGIFFGAERPGLALLDLAALTVVVAVMAVAFSRVSRTAAWLQAPYLVWLLFAASLNAWIVAAN